MPNQLQPTQRHERIGSLDFLRGVAVLGILLINIESFSYPNPWSPFSYGFANSIDREARFWVYTLAQGKFFSMFTLLFGVGFYIFLERLEGKGYGLKALDIYARRLLWLFVFGLVHAYFIWNGDVLYHYAACGFFLFPFRSMRIKQLLLTLLLFATILLFNSYQRSSATHQQYITHLQASQVEVVKRTPQDEEIISRWERRTRRGSVDTASMDVPRQNLYQNWIANTEHTQVHKGVVLHQGIFFRTLIMMILGIVLYKLNVFQNYRTIKYYWLVTVGILVIALTVNYLRYYHWTYEYFRPVKDVWQGWLFTFPKEALGLAYVLLLNGLYQKYRHQIKFTVITDVGRMALTNYILQSVICGLLFYGYGLGKYNTYSRSELLYVVLVIWAIQLIVSRLWMKKFAQGPLEKLWRDLTYKSFK